LEEFSVKAAATLLEVLVRVSKALRTLHHGSEDAPGLEAYLQYMRRCIYLSRDVLWGLTRLLVDLRTALDLIYLDSEYRADRQLAASLDSSEIFAHSRPSATQNWSNLVGYAIDNHSRTARRYNVLPTTLLEILSYLRRLYQSYEVYSDYHSLQSLLSTNSSGYFEDLDHSAELSLERIDAFSQIMPCHRFISWLCEANATDGRLPGDPTATLVQLSDAGALESIDEDFRSLMGSHRRTVDRYMSEYNHILHNLNMRRDKVLANSLDARSYHLSLALNDLAMSTGKNSYYMVLSSGIPLEEFSSVEWRCDPLRTDSQLRRDTRLRASQLFTTARGPHYHYLSTVLAITSGGDHITKMEAARECARTIGDCHDLLARVVCDAESYAARRIWHTSIRQSFEELVKTGGGSGLPAELCDKEEAGQHFSRLDVRDRADRKDPLCYFPDKDTYEQALEDVFGRIREALLLVVNAVVSLEAVDLLCELETEQATATARDVSALQKWAGEFLRA